MICPSPRYWISNYHRNEVVYLWCSLKGSSDTKRSADSRQKYSTDNNSSQRFQRLAHHYYHEQQQRERDDMRRKLMQWCEWRRRYGVLSSIYIAEHLRRPQFGLLQPNAAFSRTSNSTSVTFLPQ